MVLHVRRRPPASADVDVPSPRDEVTRGIRREAKVVGLGELDMPTLEAVERRRLQLLLVMVIMLVAVSVSMALITLLDGETLGWFPPWVTRVGVVALAAGFCAYAVEKEMHLRRLTRLLVEERVLTSALSNRLRELSSLVEAGKAVNSVLELDDVLRIILDSAMELLDAHGGSVLLLDDVGDLRAVCVRGNEAARDSRIHMGEGIAGRVAQDREPLLINGAVDERAFPGLRNRGRTPNSAMSAPLMYRDELLGVLNVNASEGRSFTEYDLRALSLFGEHAASAIANARLYEAERGHAHLLEHQAFHDPLTQLANRALFADRVGHALARAARDGEEMAVLFLDLDDFKRINDSLGHAAGDALLIAVAKRLRSSLRGVDTAARLGGDEFAVLLEDTRIDRAVYVADRIISALESPFDVGRHRVAVRGSIGIATRTDSAMTVDAILRNADVAMYTAKSQGRNRYKVFEPSMHSAAVERLDLEADLEEAIERRELFVQYQPVVRLGDGRIDGVEALVRWNHADRGLVTPDRFVPLAESTGLVVAVDRFVLERACRQVQTWLEQGLGDDDFGLCVNLSTRTLEADNIVNDIAHILATTGLEARRLTLEITESFVLHNEVTSVVRLNELRALGVRLAIDDFGTGYSSLSYLKRLPVDVLKIDRSFVMELGKGPEDSALVRAIVHLGRSLNLQVVAEGIEDSVQLQELRQLECALGQGFHFSKAVDPVDLEPILALGRAAVEPGLTPEPAPGAVDPAEAGEVDDPAVPATISN